MLKSATEHYLWELQASCLRIVISIVVRMAAGCIPIVGYNIPGRLISVFGATSESHYYTAFAIKAFRIYLCMIVMASTALSMVREVIFGVGFALPLPVFWGLDGVLLSMPISDALTFIFAVYLICRTYRELNEKSSNSSSTVIAAIPNCSPAGSSSVSLSKR